MNGTVLTCVFCGQQYPDGTTSHGAQALVDHINQCEKHPLRAANLEIENLRRQLNIERLLRRPWLPIDQAPKSAILSDGSIKGKYLLGFVPHEEAMDLESQIEVIWWEPSIEDARGVKRGMWYGSGCYELHPTLFRELDADASILLNLHL